MRNIRLLIEYDGTAYAGWQYQPHAPTVQGAIEQAIEQVTRARSTLYGSGRTDAGVHARGQVANFRTASGATPFKLRAGINATTPRDIYVLDAEEVPDAFHARKSAIGKRYSYTLLAGGRHPALDRHRIAVVHERLDPAPMQEAAAMLVGTHDFAAFQNADSPRADTVRTLTRLEMSLEGALFRFTIEGTGFLYKMCRTLVGTLVEVGLGKRQAASVLALLAHGDRTLAGQAMPAKGLVLEEVMYPEELLGGHSD